MTSIIASPNRKPSSQAVSTLPDQPVVVNDASDKLTRLSIADLWVYRELLYFLTWRDIKVRYKQTAMGAAWAIIQPFFMMLTFAVFFGLLVGVPTDGMSFLLFFYCGLLPWTFFSTAVSVSSTSLVSNAHLISKVYFPRVIVPTAAIGALLVDLLITLGILIGLAVYYRIELTWNVTMLPVMILLTIVLALDFGIWLAALTVKYRDIRHALPFILQLWMFLTPVVYPLSVVPAKWRWLMYVNPLTGVVEGIRSSLNGSRFNREAIAVSAMVSIVMLFSALYAFRRIEKSFADLI